MSEFGAAWCRDLMVDRPDSDTLAKVLGLLGVAAGFTAIGAFIGPALGDAGFWIGLVGGLVTLVVLSLARGARVKAR